MKESQIIAVSERLLMAWRSGQRQPSSDLCLEDEASAYAVQERVLDALSCSAQAGRRVWKLGGGPGGLISAALVPERTVQASGWKVPKGYAMGLGIECEIAIQLGDDLPGAVDESEVFNAVEAWMPAIELCDTRFVDGGGDKPLLRLADQQMSRALVVGASCKLNPSHCWKQQQAVLKVDGQIRFEESGSHPFGRPLTNVAWLSRHAAAQGMPLQAGDIIATGSWTGLCWVHSGQNIDVCFPGIGEIFLNT